MNWHYFYSRDSIPKLLTTIILLILGHHPLLISLVFSVMLASVIANVVKTRNMGRIVPRACRLAR